MNKEQIPARDAVSEELPPIRLRIAARCPRYVCRICRTKTGWPHQLGCELGALTDMTCDDCRYWNSKISRCNHPANRRGRAAK